MANTLPWRTPVVLTFRQLGAARKPKRKMGHKVV
jgi:hypothetical protein